ncbi:hypothetical protein SAMN05880574_1561, partial [Chryseobacterium sp. RU37D]
SAGTLANGSGSLAYTISGTPSSSGTANFTVNFGGQICTFSVSVNAPAPTLKCGEAYSVDWAGHQTPIASPNGFVGTYNGGTFSFPIKIPYSGGNGQPYGTQTVYSSPSGFGGIGLILQQGVFTNGSGSMDLTITGNIPAHNNNLYSSWVINIGGTSCTLSTVFMGK